MKIHNVQKTGYVADLGVQPKVTPQPDNEKRKVLRKLVVGNVYNVTINNGTCKAKYLGMYNRRFYHFEAIKLGLFTYSTFSEIVRIEAI